MVLLFWTTDRICLAHGQGPPFLKTKAIGPSTCGEPRYNTRLQWADGNSVAFICVTLSPQKWDNKYKSIMSWDTWKFRKKKKDIKIMAANCQLNSFSWITGFARLVLHGLITKHSVIIYRDWKQEVLLWKTKKKKKTLFLLSVAKKTEDTLFSNF